MGQPTFIMKSLEHFIEHAKPFLPKSIGRQGKSLFNDINAVMGIGEYLIAQTPFTSWVGNNPLIFLDCGAVIDFEKYFHDNSCGSGGNNELRDCHKYLDMLSQTERVIIPNYMKNELENHRDCYIGKRKEISDRTFESIERINKNSMRIANNLKPTITRDKIGLDVYWAAKECFKEDEKKGFLDEISRNDRNLVVDAIYLKNSTIKGKEISASIIFSPDAHVLHLVHFLKNLDYNYQGIFAFPSRSGKDGKYEIH